MKAVDLFAGAGGFSTGAAMAGARVLWAANHKPIAVEIHRRNHAGTQHACQDLHQADWSQVPAHDLLLASPCCQGHSRARGRAGREGATVDKSRSTAWAVVSCAEFHRPKAVVIENVAEFLGWNLYPAWKNAMELLGYQLTENVLNSQDFGVPQSRERVFIVASRKKIHLAHPGLDHVAAETILDWDAGSWGPIDRPGRAASTLKQIAAGRQRWGRRFIMAYYGNDKAGRDLAKPLGTVTTKERFALVDGKNMRMFTVEEIRKAMGFPDGYHLPAAKKVAVDLLGNAVVPVVAKSVIEQVRAAV